MNDLVTLDLNGKECKLLESKVRSTTKAVRCFRIFHMKEILQKQAI